MDVSVSGTIDQIRIWRKLGGVLAPLAPPGSAYELSEVRPWVVV